MKRGYNEKLMRKQILSTREHSRNEREREREREREKEREKQQMSDKKLIFNIAYYPAFQNDKSRGIAYIINS